MTYEQHRQHLEISIIGSCILENKYNEVRFLTPKNFHVWGYYDLPFVWECLPGNIFQASDNGRKKGRDIMHMVCDLTLYSIFDRVQPMGVLLIEDEFRDGFVKTLQSILLKVDNATQKSAIIEVMTGATDYNKDVHHLIDSGINYLFKFENEVIDGMLKKFKSRMLDKVNEVRKVCNERI